MLLTITISVSALVVINFLLLKFSSNKINKTPKINKKPIGLGSMQVEFATALTGVKVNRCKLGGVGHLAGLQKGDVIEKIDGKVINTLGNTPENRLFQFQKMILEKREGKRLHLIVRTDKQRRVVIIILGKLDEQKLQKKEIIEQKKFKLEQ